MMAEETQPCEQCYIGCSDTCSWWRENTIEDIFISTNATQAKFREQQAKIERLVERVRTSENRLMDERVEYRKEVEKLHADVVFQKIECVKDQKIIGKLQEAIKDALTSLHEVPEHWYEAVRILARALAKSEANNV